MKFLRFFLLFLFLALTVHSGLMMMGCGGTAVDFDSSGDGTDDDGGDDSGGDADCDESTGPTTFDSLTILIAGTACNAPAVTTPDDNDSLEENELLLGCSDRTTTDSETDYTAVTCGSDDEGTKNLYYCSEGTVYKAGASSDTELYVTVKLTCDTDDDTLEEEEMIISLKRE
ncbi:hypothetical protein KJ708_01150 [bacterium]|nr:hypothetical protein [bacterium]MBU1917250.1 hypothetical protein [bacterium]